MSASDTSGQVFCDQPGFLLIYQCVHWHGNTNVVTIFLPQTRTMLSLTSTTTTPVGCVALMGHGCTMIQLDVASWTSSCTLY